MADSWRGQRFDADECDESFEEYDDPEELGATLVWTPEESDAGAKDPGTGTNK